MVQGQDKEFIKERKTRVIKSCEDQSEDEDEERKRRKKEEH